ncbi:hypothetical protein SmJEL517_g00614 [Synchytrium microbalum]|uniref:Thioesterase n=1 Tax=Synchytrium microbalum TaxID=1806994 RepID=A0A507CIK0_9FUNG|nr:uncharacterized protein SmJEL517_g00614 [Synchytrium microbalum]TPX37545.1 hypothetical protein SmJEL517_g00614 [Synchytrium microbalum]
MDMNIHMNNASYNKNLDYARIEFLAMMFGNYGRDVKFANAGVQCFFLKEIKPWTKYTMKTRLRTWGPKWFYLEARFESGSTLHAFSIAKFCIKEKNGKTIPFEDFLKQAGFTVTEDDLKRREANYPTAEGLMQAEEHYLATTSTIKSL